IEMLKYFIIFFILLSLSIKKSYTDQIGGTRAAIFSRFHYEPQYPFISKFDMRDLNRFSKYYNTAGPLEWIVARPYRFYTMPDGNWGYPWHFPEKANYDCLKLSSDRCEEPINLRRD